jgi:hypothetical protein
MDLVASGPEVTLAGPDTRPWPVRRRAGAVAVGVRLPLWPLDGRPLAGPLIRVPGSFGGARSPPRPPEARPPVPPTVCISTIDARLAALVAECSRLAGRSPATLAAGR